MILAAQIQFVREDWARKTPFSSFTIISIVKSFSQKTPSFKFLICTLFKEMNVWQAFFLILITKFEIVHLLIENARDYIKSLFQQFS